MKTANVFFFQRAEPPFYGSTGIAGAYVLDALRARGLDLYCTWGKPRPTTGADFLPLEVAAAQRSLPAADLTLYDDRGLALAPVRRRPGHKNVVLFHGLLGLPAHWLGNPDVDQYWANSPYLEAVLRSLLALPDWQSRTLLDPRAFDIVTHVTLPLPAVEQPAGALVGGSPLPPEAREALAAGDVVGHCLGDKADVPATAHLLLALNRLAKERGLRRGFKRQRFRLVTTQGVFAEVRAALGGTGAAPPPHLAALKAGLADLGLTFQDLFVPVPHLDQAAVFALIRGSRFGLFYDWVPESFGFYPLESVFHGCKVYTNGAGNLRHLLPAGCGLDVIEPQGLAFGEYSGCRQIAERIFRDAVEQPEAAAAETRRGAEHIRQTYGRDALARDLAAALDRLESPAGPAPDFDSLVVRWSPMVRSFDPATRRLVSDSASRELTPGEAALVQSSLGRSCGELGRQGDAAALDALFTGGILALDQPGGETSGAARPGSPP